MFCTAMLQWDGKGLGRKVHNVTTSSLTMSLGLPCTAASESSHPSVLLLFFRGSLETSSPFLGKRDVTSHQAGNPKRCFHCGGDSSCPAKGYCPTRKGQLLAFSCTTGAGYCLTTHRCRLTLRGRWGPPGRMHSSPQTCPWCQGVLFKKDQNHHRNKSVALCW